MRRRFNWGLAVIVVYGAFATSTLGFVAFALNQPADLVSPDYYQRSLVEDRRIDAKANARALGAALSIDLDRTAGAILVRAPMREATGTITLYRPSGSAADRVLPLALGDGLQRVPWDGLASGRWLVQLEWSAGGRPYYYEAGVAIP